MQWHGISMMNVYVSLLSFELESLVKDKCHKVMDKYLDKDKFNQCLIDLFF